MKKCLFISILCLVSIVSFSQGLEGIIVETYYITDENDAKFAAGTTIQPGNVCYRIFVDMKPGYKLQSIYGAPGHEMKLSTSTSFYNHSTHGHYISNLVMDRLLPGDALMLDSWISTGAGSQQQYGVLKSDDDSVRTIKNLSRPLMMQNENPLAGVPIKLRDGLMAGDTLPPRVTQIGIDKLLEDLYKNSTTGSGYLFVTSNGGWGCLGGASGCNPEINKVLIGQFTTDGDFNFEFNIQIGSAEHKVEQYVARNPVDAEQLYQGLIVFKPSLYNRKN